MAPSEAVCADVARALVHVLDVPETVHFLMSALRSRTVGPSRVTLAVTHAADRALANQLFEALHAVVMEALDEPAWHDLVRDEHGAAALEWALAGLPGRRTETLLLIGAWVRARGSLPAWASAAYRGRPNLLVLLRPPGQLAWSIHCAAPTASGWSYLAGTRERDSFPVGTEAFGVQSETAFETLGHAIEQEEEGPRRVVLAGWLTRLAT
jgi:hypothetical protein